MLAIAITVFLAIFLMLVGFLLYLNRSADPVARRLKRIRGEGADSGEADARGTARKGDPADKLFAIDPESFSSTRADLTHAGYRGRYALAWYWGLRVFMAALLGGAAYYVKSILPFTDPILILFVLGATAGGFITPQIWVQSRVRRRRDDIRRAIPNVLDLIIVCVEAGLGLNAAVQRISREMRQTYPELAKELNILNQEIFLGINRAEAFRNLALRTGVDELRSLATVLMQSDRLGTSVADVLRVQADNLRTKRRQMALEIAAKMPVKLLFPLVFFIFPQLLVIILGPAMIGFLRAFADIGQ
jgi:tight adherence protein C